MHKSAMKFRKSLLLLLFIVTLQTTRFPQHEAGSRNFSFDGARTFSIHLEFAQRRPASHVRRAATLGVLRNRRRQEIQRLKTKGTRE